MECDIELSSVRHVSIMQLQQMQLSYSMGVGVTLRRALSMPLNA